MKKFFKYLGITLLIVFGIGNISRTRMKNEYYRNRRNRTSYDNSFESQIEKANRDCPIPIMKGKSEVSAIKLEDGYVTYYLSYDDSYDDNLAKIHNNPSMKEGFLCSFLCMNAQQNGLGDMFMDKLIEENTGIKIVINKTKSNEFECKMSPSEITQFREKFKLNPHVALYNILKLNVESNREQLPMEIDEGMTMTDYELEDDNIVITMIVDENLYEIESFQENAELIRESMVDEGQYDPESKALLDLCKVSHTGLIYRTIGNITKKKVDVVISSDYIRQHVTTPSTINIR
mgnify:CR=1 FL=1